jgi:acetoin utilization deacetylase AcuC-like enzyme
LADLATPRSVHSNRYVDALEGARPADGYVYLDGGDTMMEPSTWEVVLRGVGGTLQAIDKVLTGQVQNAFVACRPPGHHAETERAMGFCLFNNVSIGARHAQQQYGVTRVAIVDFDVHHGNGTQETSTPMPMCCMPPLIRCRSSPEPGRQVKREWAIFSTHR